MTDKQPLEAQLQQLRTELERMQSEAVEAYDRQRTVLETMPIGVLIVNERNEIVDMNRNVERLYAGTVPLTQPLQEYRHHNACWTATGQPVGEDEWPSAQAIKRGEVIPGQEIDIQRADGTRVTVLDAAAPLCSPEGQVLGAVVVIQDITERKRAEAERERLLGELQQLNETLEQRVQERTTQLTQALEREKTVRADAESARRQFEGLLESAPDGIVIVDAVGIITLVNTQAERMSGYAREELTGHPVEILVPERLGDIHIKHRADYMSEPRTRPMGVGLDLYLRRKDGGEVPVEISLSPFQSPAGILVIASIRDITARKQAEAEINRLNDELQHHVEQLKVANQELEAFSYSVSHDLRAPLRSLDGFSQILVRDYKDALDQRGQDYLNRIRAASQRMGRLIDDMLSLSRIGRAQMHREPVNLSELAASVVEELRQRDPNRQVEVTIAQQLIVNADPAQMRIVLDNLIGNAWKFTSHREVGCIEVGATTRDHETAYYVRDNGAGFNMDYVDKLFTPFQRLHTEAEFPGTGIGLAIVQRILARHNGRIWAEAKEGEGATFVFVIGEEKA